MDQKRTMQELGRMTPEDFRRSSKHPIVLVLDQIRSGLNVGSIFRSADAFRCERIICCGYTPVPPHREVLKTALGATESVAWSSCSTAEEALVRLKSEGYTLIALEQTINSTQLDRYTPEAGQKLALVLGNEVSGVSDPALALCETTLEIAQEGTKHSLNVAVSAGIALFHLTRGISAVKA